MNAPAPHARYTAILLAGSRPEGDAMATRFGVAAKALIPVAGRSMLDRVARTLLASPEVAQVVLLAQTPDALLAGDAAWLATEPCVTRATGGGGIAQSIAAIAGGALAPWPVLVVTADHALLTPAMVAEFAAGAGRADVAVAVVGRRRFRAAFPDNRRTWLRFADDGYSGANLFALNGPRAAAALAKWAEVERDRKKAWRLIAQFGWGLALRAVTRTIGFDAALARAAGRLGFSAVAVRMSAPEAAIDVDKPADHAQAEAILRARGG